VTLFAIESLSDATAIGLLITFATVLVNLIVSLYREKRDRRWKLEDEAQKVERERLEQVRAKAEADEHRKATAVTHGLIEENTQLSRAAFIEANRVNEKIVQVGERRNALYDDLLKRVSERETDQRVNDEKQRERECADGGNIYNADDRDQRNN